MMGAFKIIERPEMVTVEQTQYPRSKKRRIREKFRKRYTAVVPSQDLYICGDMIVCHPSVAAQLKERCSPVPEKPLMFGYW